MVPAAHDKIIKTVSMAFILSRYVWAVDSQSISQTCGGTRAALARGQPRARIPVKARAGGLAGHASGARLVLALTGRGRVVHLEERAGRKESLKRPDTP